MNDESKVKIVDLKIENFMRIIAVHITPDGNTIVIGGNNTHGKSSVLNAITSALGGKGTAPDEPVHNRGDAKKAVSEFHLSNGLVVKRTFTKSGGGTLTIKNADGTASYSSPQKMLDALFGELAFDPLEFFGMKDKDQAALLCSLAGIDLEEFEARRKAVYDERTDVNREVKRLEGLVASIPFHKAVPDAEVSAADYTAKHKEAMSLQSENNAARDNLARAKLASERMNDDIAVCQKNLDTAKAKYEESVQKQIDAAALVDQLVDPDFDEINKAISEIDATNAKVRQNKERFERAGEYADVKIKSNTLTADIDKIDAEKTTALAAAALPVAGLSFNDTGATFNDLPIKQASGAEQIRISVAIGLALNPKSGLLLIRDGSLLDADNLEIIRQVAEDNDAQLFIERVGHGDECQVIIEDGMVETAEQALRRKSAKYKDGMVAEAFNDESSAD